MSVDKSEVDVLDIILKNNLEIIDNTYLILNVINKSSGSIQPMCLGEIGSFQTAQAAGDSMSVSSSTGELPSC
ncbi:LEF-10 [Adoxophyes orana nucleopolyhedrovirus]|uniref:LEF-10 n=1 Tax=Adoxophyes orana nucleopolyhedrovirus TaxID=542343 RepID=UPI0001829BF8|nr:LEF-10 [Adoxophyes orana nucleopolyhedrovirus]ACF05332.1 LEF-10 [Adoxophyes orana nucleopolyhedrovirus]